MYTPGTTWTRRVVSGSERQFTLSNVLDGAPAAYRARLLAAVRRAAAPNARLVLRSFAEPPESSPSNAAADDRAMLWGRLDVAEVSAAAA